MGKILFSLFDSLSDIDEKVMKERWEEIETIRTKEKLHDIYQTLQSVVDGEIQTNHEEYYLKNSGFSEPISFHNLSTDYFMGLAKQEKKFFGIDKLEKYLFNDTHTYTKELFKKNFVLPIEKEEKQTS